MSRATEARSRSAAWVVMLLVLAGVDAVRAEVVDPYRGFFAGGGEVETGGKLLVVGGTTLADKRTTQNGLVSRALAVVRQSLPGRVRDRSFADDGIAVVPIWGFGEIATAIALQQDGRIVVAGYAVDPAEPDGNWVVLLRMLPDGLPDRTFNRTGRLVMRIGQGYTYLAAAGIHVSLDAAIEILDERNHVIARVSADGTIDANFSCAGGSAFSCVTREVVVTTLIEFHHRRLDHYFMTADPAEFTLLDRGAFEGWERTGEAFHVGPPGAGDVPVCRAYGLPQAGLDTHFYSADANECARLAPDPAWVIETDDAFLVARPDPARGTCPRGRVPLYRLWNGRADTNHRYTTSQEIRDRMVVRGYVAEGYGPSPVAWCVAP